MVLEEIENDTCAITTMHSAVIIRAMTMERRNKGFADFSPSFFMY